MRNISKPELVRFIRFLMFKQMLRPNKIRFASIRSKAKLMSDLRNFFTISFDKHYLILDCYRKHYSHLPKMKFHLQDRLWFFGEVQQDLEIPKNQVEVKIRHNVWCEF